MIIDIVAGYFFYVLKKFWKTIFSLLFTFNVIKM